MISTLPAFVALDRDGTLIEHVPYLRRASDVRLKPTAGQAVSALNRMGVRVVLVTNQSVLAKGLLDDAGLMTVHDQLCSLLVGHDARLDEILVCPHAAEDGCPCRKPLPALLKQYLDQEGLEPRDGYVVGDNVTDVELGRNIGARPIHVQGGSHSKLAIHVKYPDVVSVSNLGEVVSLIVDGVANGNRW